MFSDRGIQLVVLNSCFSDVQAKALGEAVPALVRTTAAVDDEAARRFSTAFHRTIGNGHTVGDAFRDGRDAVEISMLEDVFRMHGDDSLVLVGRKLIVGPKTTANLVAVIRRLTPLERLLFRAILKASSAISPKVFREFLRAPNVIGGYAGAAHRFRLRASVGASDEETTPALRNLLRYGVIVAEELSDILFMPSPEVVAIVIRSPATILGSSLHAS